MSEESASIKNNSDKGFGKKAIVFAAFLAVALIAGASWILISKSRAETRGQAPAAPAVKEVLHLEGFVVNLADPSGACYLRVGIDLGLGHATNKRGEKDNGAIPTAQVRDVVLRILTTYRSDDLLAPEGKIKLKRQLVQSLQAAVPELGVQEVYFTDFLVQR